MANHPDKKNRPPKPIEQVVFDRLHASLRPVEGGAAADVEKRSLQQLGSLMCQWRIKNNFTRQLAAQKLGLNAGQLLCLEHGLGLPGDVAQAQVCALSTWLTEDALDQRLRIAIEQYLAGFKA